MSALTASTTSPSITVVRAQAAARGKWPLTWDCRQGPREDIYTDVYPELRADAARKINDLLAPTVDGA